MEISKCGICFSCQKSGQNRLFVVVNVQAVRSPDIVVTTPCLKSIFKSQQGFSMPAVTEEGPVGRSQTGGCCPEPPSALWTFEDRALPDPRKRNAVQVVPLVQKELQSK